MDVACAQALNRYVALRRIAHAKTPAKEIAKVAEMVAKLEHGERIHEKR